MSSVLTENNIFGEIDALPIHHNLATENILQPLSRRRTALRTFKQRMVFAGTTIIAAVGQP
jgi:hypothetical protein